MRLLAIVSVSLLLAGCGNNKKSEDKQLKQKKQKRQISLPPRRPVSEPRTDLDLDDEDEDDERVPLRKPPRPARAQGRKGDLLGGRARAKTEVLPVSYDDLATRSLALLKQISAESEPAGKAGPDLGLKLENGLVEATDNGPVQVGGGVINGGASAGHSVVVPTTGMEVIKYLSNCGAEKDKLLKRNHVLMQVIKSLETDLDLAAFIDVPSLVPDSIYLSGPSVFDATSVSDRKLFEDNQAACYGSEISYQVMSRAGISLRAWSTAARPSLVNALSIGMRVLDMTLKLHAIGIVHGDIQWDNVLLSSSSSMSLDSELVFVDFDRAWHVLDKSPVPQSGKAPLAYLAPNEMGTEKPSLWSDVFRVYEMMEALVRGDDYYAELDGLTREALIKRKLTTPLLALDGKVAGAKSTYEKARNEFHELIVSGLKSPALQSPIRSNAAELLRTMFEAASSMAASL